MLWIPALLANIALTAALYLYARRWRSRDFAGSLVSTYIWGAVMIIPIMVFQTAAFSYISEDQMSLPLLLISAFGCTALVETILKFLALYADTRRTRLYRLRFDAVLITVFLFCGFQLAELLFLIINPINREGVWLRYLTGLPLQVCTGALMGCFYGRTKTFCVPYVFNNTCAILLPFLAHGIWETAILACLNGNAFGPPLLIVCSAAALGLTGWLFVREALRVRGLTLRAEAEEAERIRRREEEEANHE
ncbi:MAG: PrsW family intramembrane metalloprotease [Clostridia bacterium]|nr:PrsW family intramembrane metalloprotease [Clostridia bacterium]